MQLKVLYGGKEIHCESFVHDEALKIKLEVLPNGRVLLKAPASYKKPELKAYLLKKARWVLTQQEELAEQRQHVRERQYVSGECYFYLGRRYVLKVQESEMASVKLLRGSLEVKSAIAKDIKALLAIWYKQHAKAYYAKRLAVLAKTIPWVDELPEMKLLSMKTQWGSCSPKGVIILNPYLVKARRECIDYVIIHELCHLQEHNHSPRFYKLLEQSLPNWKETKQKLDSMAELYLNE